MEGTREFLQGTLIVLGALLPIVNPIGNAPFFLALTASESPATRSVLARKVAINGLCLLLAALFLGDDVLAFFGVSVPVVQMAGGLVVAGLAWRLLHQGEDAGDRSAPTSAGASEARAFYPLTLPLTVGPGSISVAIAIGANFPSTVQTFLFDSASAVTGVVIVCAITYVCYRYAEATAGLLGKSGMAVVLRLSAFIMLCIGMQIMWNGADALLHIAPVPAPAARMPALPG
jgi:multiple antibiotic resistance protein